MTSIGWSGLAISLLLVLVAIVVSLWKQLGLERSIAWAAVRAAAQLFAIGLLLQVLLRPGVSILWAWLWVAAMVVIASLTVRQRAPEVPGLLLLALLAFGCSAVLTLGVLFGLGVFQLNVRTLIPLAGLMIGNSLAATVLVGRRLVEELRDEARRSRSPPGSRTTRPHRRQTVRARGSPHCAHSPDRDHQGCGPCCTSRGYDRPHPRRREPIECCPRSGGGDVPRARIRRNYNDRDRPRCSAPPVHPRPPASTSDRRVVRPLKEDLPRRNLNPANAELGVWMGRRDGSASPRQPRPSGIPARTQGV